MYRDSHQLSRNGAEQARAWSTDALYVISVAARLVELHPTTLRKYERVGFLEPSRTPGRTRLYSHEDIRRLRQIKRLVEQREMNLAGVQMALDLTTLLREIVNAIDRAPDLQTLQRRVQDPLREAFATLGALEESR
ncbi:MAG: MerR family transcriptional regulator [Chloroflexi bacterium]|nr:MerR family transcriptional regulator [Chloroflexota bacterium]